MKRALIIGGKSQCGVFLYHHLTKEGYGVTRTTRAGMPSTASAGDWLINTDLARPEGLEAIRQELSCHDFELVFNVASVMHAQQSWHAPMTTSLVNYVAPVSILAMLEKVSPESAFVQAGSAEMFAHDAEPKTLESKVEPSNPYGIAKAAAFMAVKSYREQKGLLCGTAVLYNMESHLRADSFFARKAVLECVKLSRKLKDESLKKVPGAVPAMRFGPLHAVRDWGLTRVYSLSMVRMAQQMLASKHGFDAMFASGQSYSCETFVRAALHACGIEGGVEQVFDAQPSHLLKPDTMYVKPCILPGGVKAPNFMQVVEELVTEELNSKAGSR